MKLNLRNNIIEERIDFDDVGEKDGSQIIAIYGSKEAGIPPEVYELFDDFGHHNRDYYGDNNKPYFLGWISYKMIGTRLVINAMQSDVLERTSYIKYYENNPNYQQIIPLAKKYKSRLENRYYDWRDQAFEFMKDKANNNNMELVLQIPDLESGVRLNRILSAAKRARIQLT